MSQLNGQVALVTGAEVGIGRATALELARAGADVAVHYYADQAAAGEVVREIASLGRRAEAFGADLTRSAEVTRVVGGALARFGRIDILVNNAGGLLGRHSLPDMPEAFFHDVMNVNVLTTFLCCQAVAPGMIAQGSGAIVNLTSLAAHNGGGPGRLGVRRREGRRPRAHQGLRQGTRAARHPRERRVARPHRRHAVPQDLHGARGVRRDGQDASRSAGRATPDDVARVITFLAGGDAAYLSGETIEINGGMYHAIGPSFRGPMQ